MRSVLVVIPTLNEVHTIDGVLDVLAVDPPPDATLHFVVADGGSNDGTVERVREIARQRADVSLLHNPDRIQSAAVNRAAAVHGAGAEVLIRCDAHALYPSGYCRRLLHTLDRTGADAVVVPMDSTGSGCFQKAVAWVSDTPVGSGGSAHRGGQRSGFVDHGHHAAFRMASFRRAGGYDSSFTHNEDAELDCRQRAWGSRVYLDAQTRVAYHPRGNAAALARQYFRYGQGRSRTVRRHPESLRLRQLAVPVHLLFSLIALLLAARWPVLLWWPGVYIAALAVTSLALAWRQRSACALLAGPAAALMHTAWAIGFFWGWATARERRWSIADVSARAGGT
jgi:succinoglycan biosynthesis protein ExoA